MRVILSAAMSIDGYIDDASDKRLILSNEADFAAVRELRNSCDAILVGAETIRKDNPSLTPPSNPIKVTMTRSGSLSPDAKFFTEGRGKKLVYTTLKHHSKNAEWISLTEDDFLPAMLADLQNRNIKRLLVEGGASILTQFLAANLADELRLAIAPVFVGGGTRLVNPAVFPPNRMTLKSTEQLGDMAVLHYGRAP